MFIAHTTQLLTDGIASAILPDAFVGMFGDGPWVVGCAQEEHHGIGVAQSHAIERSSVVGTRIGRCIHFAAPAVHETRLHGHVEHLFALSVVHARVLLQLTFSLVGLDVLHSLNGQLTHQHLLAQCLVAIHH